MSKVLFQANQSPSNERKTHTRAHISQVGSIFSVKFIQG